MGTFFSYARTGGLPTMHKELKTSVTVDVLETGFILAFVLLAFTYLIIIPGKRGKALPLLVRVTVSLFIGVIIMIGNFGQEWEVSETEVKTPYKAGSPHEFNAAISMKIGLRSVNITLKRADATSNGSHDPFKGEIINYNERFSWTWDQGRFGFGPYAGRLQQEFRAAQVKGLPLPILWIADYFTWDGEGLRFGRHYRTAGWYAHIAMWAAFPCWLIANVLYLSILSYAAYCTLLTGGLQILACILWTSIRNPEPLSIPIGDKEMTTVYGVSYWLTLASGILCIIIGTIVLILDLRLPNQISDFFGIDPLTIYEEFHLTESEVNKMGHNDGTPDLNMVTISPENDGHERERMQVILKRRTTVRLAQKNLVRRPQPVPRVIDEEPVYLNVPQQPLLQPQYADELSTSYHSTDRLHNVNVN